MQLLNKIVQTHMEVLLDECNLYDWSSDHSNKSIGRLVCIHKGHRLKPEDTDLLLSHTQQV